MPRPEGVWGVTQGRLRALARQESNPETMQWWGWNFNTDTETENDRETQRHAGTAGKLFRDNEETGTQARAMLLVLF